MLKSKFSKTGRKKKYPNILFRLGNTQGLFVLKKTAVVRDNIMNGYDIERTEAYVGKEFKFATRIDNTTQKAEAYHFHHGKNDIVVDPLFPREVIFDKSKNINVPYPYDPKNPPNRNPPPP